MELKLWLISLIPLIVSHFFAKEIGRIADVPDSNQSFYLEVMAILMLIQYACFFAGSFTS